MDNNNRDYGMVDGDFDVDVADIDDDDDLLSHPLQSDFLLR